MKAWIVEHVGGPEVLTLADIPAPQAKADEVKIRVRAFGLNRAEVYRRTGMMGPIDSPVVP
ncbi:MAG: alcohol dehydrogenase, partial [Deltaproteobacteria bacterium]